MRVNLLKRKFAKIVFNDSVRTEKKTPHFTISKINLLIVFKELIAVYNKNHKKIKKYRLSGC